VGSGAAGVVVALDGVVVGGAVVIRSGTGLAVKQIHI